MRVKVAFDETELSLFRWIVYFVAIFSSNTKPVVKILLLVSNPICHYSFADSTSEIQVIIAERSNTKYLV